MMLTPWAFRSATTCSSRSVSDRVSDEVGSSMMITRASMDSALAISTSCRCAMESVSTCVYGPNSAPSRRSSGVTRSCIVALSTRRSGPPVSASRPMNTFAATSRFSNRFSSWWTKAMPARIASETVRAACSRPSMRTWPALGAVTPPMIFISVDLPAPFSPISPRTSPRPTRRVTSSSAVTPGYVFLMPMSSSSGSVKRKPPRLHPSPSSSAPSRSERQKALLPRSGEEVSEGPHDADGQLRI